MAAESRSTETSAHITQNLVHGICSQLQQVHGTEYPNSGTLMCITAGIPLNLTTEMPRNLTIGIPRILDTGMPCNLCTGKPKNINTGI
jgi:hypothetical protein